MRNAMLASCLAWVMIGVAPAAAGDITQEWQDVKIPPPPALNKVDVDPKTTALLVLDLMKSSCGRRPRCIAMVPTISELLATARRNGMMIVYNLTGQNTTAADMIDPAIVPRTGEFIIENGRGGDKFIDSNLDAGLKARGVKTVIVTGTSAQGAVATTSNGAAQRGYRVVVPVDGMSSESAFNELYAAWHLAKGGPTALVDNVILTRTDLLTFAQ